MRVLLDESVPRQLAPLLHSHSVSSQLGVVVIAAPDNRVHTITALAPDVLAALTQIEHGEVIKVPQRQSARDRRRPLR